jgi:hypothetical protein
VVQVLILKDIGKGDGAEKEKCRSRRVEESEARGNSESDFCMGVEILSVF